VLVREKRGVLGRRDRKSVGGKRDLLIKGGSLLGSAIGLREKRKSGTEGHFVKILPGEREARRK